MGAVSVTGNEHYRTPFEPMIGGVKFADYNNLESVKALVTDKTCAIILEPVQGEGGIYPADEEFLKAVCHKYADRLAVGVDIKDGFVAIKGWTEKSNITCFDFCEKMQSLGISALICTDISRDGAMRGTNLELYRELSEKFSMKITASGGVSTLYDVEELTKMKLWGAIIGKAYYTGDIDLEEAVRIAKNG